MASPLVSGIYAKTSGKAKTASDIGKLKPVSVTLPNGKLVKFASESALQTYIADLARAQKRLIDGKTIAKQSGTALLDSKTLLPLHTPRAATGSKAKNTGKQRFAVDGY
jgi:hypothetical protein